MTYTHTHTHTQTNGKVHIAGYHEKKQGDNTCTEVQKVGYHEKMLAERPQKAG